MLLAGATTRVPANAGYEVRNVHTPPTLSAAQSPNVGRNGSAVSSYKHATELDYCSRSDKEEIFQGVHYEDLNIEYVRLIRLYILCHSSQADLYGRY